MILIQCLIFVFPLAPLWSKGSPPPQQPSVAQELSWCRARPPPLLLRHLLSNLPNTVRRGCHSVPPSHIQLSIMCEVSGFCERLHEGKLSDGAQCAWEVNNVGKENMERKVKVDRPASEHMSSWKCVAVDYCEMSLMREFVAFKSIILRGTIHVLSVNDNIGLNLFT